MLIISIVRIINNNKNETLAYVTISLIILHFLSSYFIKVVAIFIPLGITVCAILIYRKLREKQIKLFLLTSLILYWIIPFTFNLIRNINLAK